MATQTQSPPPAPSAQVIGNVHHSPELVYRFYQDTSRLSRPDPSGIMTTVTTMKISGSRSLRRRQIFKHLRPRSQSEGEVLDITSNLAELFS